MNLKRTRLSVPCVIQRCLRANITCCCNCILLETKCYISNTGLFESCYNLLLIKNEQEHSLD